MSPNPLRIVSPRLFRDRFLFEVAISFFVAKLVCRRARPGGLDQWRIAQIFLYRACGLGLRLQNKEYLCAILGAALYCTYFLCTVKRKYSINSLVYWVTYVHNVVYSFYRSMIYCYINSTQRCAGSIVIDIIPTNGADKRKFFPFAPYFPVTNVIKRYFYPYFPAIIGIKGYSFPYFPYLSGIMKIKTALYSLFSRLDWHKTVVFPCLGEIYEGIRSLSWEIPVT